MAEAHLVLSIARVATAALAGTIGILGARAYLATRRRSILALSVGAILLGVGYLTEGLLVEAAGWSVYDATIVESITTLVASTILVASLYLKEARAALSSRAEGAMPAAARSPP